MKPKQESSQTISYSPKRDKAFSDEIIILRNISPEQVKQEIQELLHANPKPLDHGENISAEITYISRWINGARCSIRLTIEK